MEEEKEETGLMVMDMFSINRLPPSEKAEWKRNYRLWRDRQRKQDKKEVEKIRDKIYRMDYPERVKAINKPPPYLLNRQYH